MKIYADSYYNSFLKPGSFKSLDHDINTIPDGVDIIAVTMKDGDIDKQQEIINQLLPKTKKLFVTLLEAVHPNLVDFLLSNNNLKIEFFVDAIINCSIPNVKSITSWFISPINFYKTEPTLASMIDKLDVDMTKPKLFDCLLGTEKDHRTQITRFYKNSNYRDKFIFTYFKDNLHNGLWNIDIPQEIKFTASRLKYQQYHIPLSAVIPVDIYNQSYYSVVAETTYYNDYNQYTEKIAKPILAKRLFVVFAGQHYLRNLKAKGFMTFASVVDESYDTIEDPDIRFFQAWKQIEYLCTQDPKEVMNKIDHILKHNQRHFLDTDWHSNLKLTLENHSGARLP